MPVDSTADLLFRIGANSDDAEDNISRFRSLLSKDLSDIGGEFEDWSHQILGNISTVQGAAAAAGAVLAAAVVGVAAAANEATNHYTEYVEEVARGTKTTGISMEAMSGLKFAADETNTSYDALVTGLTRFSSTVVTAAEGGQKQQEMFQRLGISQEQVKAGEKDMLPLLMSVADKFQGMSSQVDRAAMARELFSRGGAELVNLLSQGSEGLRKFAERARELGLLLSEEDRTNLREHKATLEALKAQYEAMEVVIGRVMSPLKESWQVLDAAIVKTAFSMATWKDLVANIGQPGMAFTELLTRMGMNARELAEEIDRSAQSIGKLGPNGLDDAGKKVKEVATDFRGFSEVLSEIKTKTADTQGEEAKLVDQVRRLQDSLSKAGDEYRKLRAEGKLATETETRENAAFLAAARLLPGMIEALTAQATEKSREAIQSAGNQLREELLKQGPQTMAVRVALWDMEMAARREKLKKEVGDQTQNSALLAEVERAGYEKISREEAIAMNKASDSLDARIAAQGEQTLAKKKAAFNREVAQLADEHATLYGFDEEYEKKLEALRKAGLDKIDADEKAAGDTEIARLKAQAERVDREHQTAGQRIAAEYQAELARFVAGEEKKTLALATGEAQRAQLSTMFAAIRKGLLDKEQADLQALQNSTGWQGVFGSKFAELIRGNEEMLKQWQTSTNQSTMLVKVTLEGLKEQGQKTFEQLAQGMGSNIAHAVIYSKSIGQAMKAMLESTLESLSAQAITYAIYSTALGFTDLAAQDYVGADAAFTAAAIWGSVGAAAAVSGRAMAGSPASTGGSGSGAPGVGQYGSQTAARQSDMAGSPAPASASGPHTTVNVYGHVVGVSGVADLCSMINDAVLNQDVPLTATNTTTGVQVRQ